MSKTRRFSMGATALVMVAALVACGGGSKTPTKADYLLKGNAICSKASAALALQTDKLNKDDEKAAEKFLKNTAVPSVRKQLGQLRALGYPKGDKALLDAIFTKTQKLLDQAAKDPAAALQDSTYFDSVNSALSAYGLTDCAGS